MMKNKIYIFLTFAFLLLTFAFISGCGKYAAQYSAPVIISRYPALGADGIGSAEALWVKFSKRMDTSGTSFNDLINKIVPALDNKATVLIFPDITPESFWLEDDTRLVIRNIFFVASPEGRVHILASREAFKDMDDLKIPENATLWDYTLSGLNILSRSPSLDAIVTNEAMTLEVTFNNPVSTLEVIGISAIYGLVTPEPSPPDTYWTNSDKTLNIGLNSWEVYGYPATIEVSYRAKDIYGNKVNNGTLLKYILINP